jgi:hypothetical protein
VKRRAIVVACFSFACSADKPHTVVAIAPASAQPVATLDASLLPPSTRPRRPGADACLMLYECGCNASCTKVDRPMDALSPGMQVRVTSEGPLKGTTVFVAKNETASGEHVLTVQRADPNAGIHICAMNARSSTFGYLCATSNSGPARACSTCD